MRHMSDMSPQVLGGESHGYGPLKGRRSLQKPPLHSANHRDVTGNLNFLTQTRGINHSKPHDLTISVPDRLAVTHSN